MKKAVLFLLFSIFFPITILIIVWVFYFLEKPVMVVLALCITLLVVLTYYFLSSLSRILYQLDKVKEMLKEYLERDDMDENFKNHLDKFLKEKW